MGNINEFYHSNILDVMLHNHANEISQYGCKCCNQTIITYYLTLR
jgi:hypothetical protein